MTKRCKFSINKDCATSYWNVHDPWLRGDVLLTRCNVPALQMWFACHSWCVLSGMSSNDHFCVSLMVTVDLYCKVSHTSFCVLHTNLSVLVFQWLFLAKVFSGTVQHYLLMSTNFVQKVRTRMSYWLKWEISNNCTCTLNKCKMVLRKIILFT